MVGVSQSAEDLAWDKLGAFSSDYMNSVVGVTTLFGPFQDLMPKEARQATRRRGRERLGDLVNPDELEDAQACCSEQQETDKNMEEMLNVLLDPSCLDDKGRAPFPELVFNPNSFSQTVENVFTLSFLVKDGRAKLQDNPQKKGGILVSNSIPSLFSSWLWDWILCHHQQHFRH